MKIFLSVFFLLITHFASAQKFNYCFVFERESGKGIVDSLGTVLLPAYAQDISFSNDGKYASIQQTNGKYGVLNDKFDTIIPFKYDGISFSNNLFEVQLNDLKGVINDRQKIIIPIAYKSLARFTLPFNGYSYETIDGKYGILTEKGAFIVKDVPYSIDAISKKIFDVKMNDDHYFVNAKMKKIHDFPFRFSSKMAKDYSRFFTEQNNQFFSGLINTSGKIPLPAVFNHIQYNEKYQFFIVEKEGKYGMLNRKFKTILPIEFDKISFNQNSNRFTIQKNKKYGFADEKGKMIIDFIYDEAEDFSEGLAAVVTNGKWGFIDENGKTVIDFNFKGKMKGFVNNHAVFYEGKFTTTGRFTSFKASLLNKKGNFVIVPEYEEITYCFGNKAIVTKNGFKYLVDTSTNKELFQLTQDDRIFNIQG